jgi:hypothetical protein
MSEPTLNDLPIRRTVKRYAVATKMEIPSSFIFETIGEAWEIMGGNGGYVIEQRTTVTLRVMDAR